MTAAFLFPGQGVEMARILAEWDSYSSRVRRLMDTAAREAGVPRQELTARGGRLLDRTEILQPVLTALALGIHEELVARGTAPGCVAGHSLGELAALAAAGVLAADDAVGLAALRGRAMAREARRSPGGMVACSAPVADVAAAVDAARRAGTIAIAAYNGPRQTIVSGDASGLHALRRILSCRTLPVAGPWHSELMRGAVEEVRAAIRDGLSGDLGVPWICNRDGEVVRRVDAVPGLLADQLVHPVQWVRSMATISSLRPCEIITIGAKMLRGLVRDCLGAGIPVRQIVRPRALDTAAEAAQS